MGVQQNELHTRLRALQERAVARRRSAAHSASQVALEKAVRATDLPGADRFAGKRVSDWVPGGRAKPRVPQEGSDDALVALVAVWSQWAGEKLDERWWRDQLVRARNEANAERARRTADEESADTNESVQGIAPAALEVHQAAFPHLDSVDSPWLTPYLPRGHDFALRSALAPALAGGPSILVVLTGDSSTGKTRALYEALLRLAPSRPLLRPTTADGLRELVLGGRITSGSVLWLNESQRFFYGSSGESAAAALRDLLGRSRGVVVVGTLWQKPYWEELTRQGVPEDPHGQARALLTGPYSRQINVAAELSEADRVGMLTLAWQHSDLRLTHALAAGAGDGRVIQHLSGGPELLAAYLDGPDCTFTRGEHTLITAALTARFLGHQAPIPGALLADAAEGSLSERHRGPDGSWAGQALVALTTGVREDRTRTDIRCTLTALTALRSRSGGPVGYEPADYIQQQMSSRIADRLGGVSLWKALLRHTHAPDDLARLARAAWSRGLRKTAVQLWIKAVLAGDRQSVRALLASLSAIEALAPATLLWAAEHTPLSDVMVALLLKEAGSTGSLDTRRQVLACLVDRADCSVTDLDDVLNTLRLEGEEEAAAALLARAVTRIDPASLAEVAIFLATLTALRNDLEPEPFRRHRYTQIGFDPGTRADLSRAARERIADGALVALLAGEPGARVDLGDAHDVADLLRCLHTAHANEALAVLLSRSPAVHVPLDEPDGVARLFSALVHIGESEAAAVLLARDPAARVDLTDPAAVAQFLSCFSSVGAAKAVKAMIARGPAAHALLTDALGVAELLNALGALGELDSVATLLARHPAAHADLEMEENGFDELAAALNNAGAHDEADILQSRGLALVESLATTDLDMFALSLRPRNVGVTEEWTHTLLARVPIEEIDLTDSSAVACLLRELRDAPDSGAIAALLARAPESHADLTDAVALNELWYALDQVNATSAATALRARAARKIALDNTPEVARLLEGLRTERYLEPLAVLLARAPEVHVALADPAATAALLSELQHVQAAAAVAALLARDPASAADLSRTTAHGVQDLIGELRFAGAEEDACRLARRAADAGLLEPEGLVRFGRNADGSPTAPWGWSDVLETG